jgi:bifunctional DNase/RNase
MNNNTEIFELIECRLEKIIFDENSDYIVGLRIQEELYGIKLNSYDATMLTFVDSGCADSPHISTIHQIFLNFKSIAGYELNRVIIEAKYGDVFYCRLHWTGDKQDIYNVCSLGDALILNSLAECDMFIAQFVFTQLDKFDEEGFMSNFEE